jgi:protease-4
MMRANLGVLLTALLMGTGCFTAPLFDLGTFGRIQPLSEVTIQGEGEAKLVLLEIQGVISYEAEGFSFGGARPSVVPRLREALDLAAADDRVAGLILRIRSPGGGVAPSETLYHLVKQWKLSTHKPVIAYFQGLAASGGYYVAMAADEVIAHPTAVTGSIGVIMPSLNLSGLMEKFGIDNQSVTSGAFKDTGSFLRPMRNDEKRQLQSVIDDLYNRFVEVVDDGRPNLVRKEVLALADGRIYTANQALESGLIDRIGHLDDVFKRAEALAGLSDSKIISYRAAGRPISNVYSDISSKTSNRTDFNLISIGAASIPAGFYYLWPMALP